MRWRTMMAVVAALSLMVMACGEAAEEPGDQSGLANPASAYCEEQGGTVEMRLDDTGGTYGVCVFSDGSECEEWTYFRGECAPESGATMTIDEALASTEEGPITVTGYLFVDTEGNATLASLIAESFPPQAAGATMPVQVDLSRFSFSEDQGLRWTDQMVNVEGTLVDGVLVGLVGD
jgi:putative hemolysin